MAAQKRKERALGAGMVEAAAGRLAEAKQAAARAGSAAAGHSAVQGGHAGKFKAAGAAVKAGVSVANSAMDAVDEKSTAANAANTRQT